MPALREGEDRGRETKNKGSSAYLLDVAILQSVYCRGPPRRSKGAISLFQKKRPSPVTKNLYFQLLLEKFLF